MSKDATAPTWKDTGAAVAASIVNKAPMVGEAFAILGTDMYERR